MMFVLHIVFHIHFTFSFISVLPSVQWNRRNEKGETVLHRACIEGNFKQVQYLLDQVGLKPLNHIMNSSG